MTTKLFLAVSCLFFFSFTVLSQQTQPTVSPPNMVQMLKSPAMQQTMKNGMKNTLRTFWNGKGTNLFALELFKDPDIRNAWEVSDEQYQQLQDVPKNLMANMQKNFQEHPEFKVLAEEIRVLQSQHPGDPLLQKADEATQKQFGDIQARIGTLASDMSINALLDSTESLLTPDQKQKMNESLLASMEEVPLVAPSMFEALNLTEEQKQQMETIKKELEPEFEKNLESAADTHIAMVMMMFEELEKQGGMPSQANSNPEKMREELGEKMNTIAKKLRAENPEFKKMAEASDKQNKEFSEQINVRMFDVLTDEQWKRLLDLTDNPPEYAKVFRKKMQEKKKEQEQAASWQPGVNSWKPGDAIPEEYRKERSSGRRFPRQEN